MRNTKFWKILVAAYMIYSVSADIILICGIAWLLLTG